MWKAAKDLVANLRSVAGRNPHDRALTDLVGELSMRSEPFRKWWAAHDVRYHQTGRKRLHHRSSATWSSTTKSWRSLPPRHSGLFARRIATSVSQNSCERRCLTARSITAATNRLRRFDHESDRPDFDD
jgi:MmyB-like transcription regulator ligand binding domain